MDGLRISTVAMESKDDRRCFVDVVVLRDMYQERSWNAVRWCHVESYTRPVRGNVERQGFSTSSAGSCDRRYVVRVWRNVSYEGCCVGTYIRGHQICEGSLEIARVANEDCSAAFGVGIALQHAVVDTGCRCTARRTRTRVATTVYRISVVALIGKIADQSFAGVGCIRT